MVLFYSLVYPLLVAVVLVVTGRATVRLATLWWDTCRLSGVDVGELLAVDTGALGVGTLASSDLTLLGLARLRPELIPPPQHRDPGPWRTCGARCTAPADGPGSP